MAPDSESGADPRRRRWWQGWLTAAPVRRTLLWVGLLVAGWGLLTLLLQIAGGGGLYRPFDRRIRIQSITRSLEFLVSGAALVVMLSRRARAVLVEAARSRLTFVAALACMAAYLSLGPTPQAGRHDLNGPPLYQWLYESVPGFDGLRVPARFAAVAYLFLVLVAAWGLRDLLRRWPGRATLLATGVCVLWLGEVAVLPYPVSVGVTADSEYLLAPPRGLPVGNQVPPIYQLVRQLPANAVLLEFPIGDVAWEIQHVYHSTFHWRRMVNGYSGYVPLSYLELVQDLRDPNREPEQAWQRVLAAGITHIVVHEEAYPSDGPPNPERWLRSHGAILVGSRDHHQLYRVPGRGPRPQPGGAGR